MNNYYKAFRYAYMTIFNVTPEKFQIWANSEKADSYFKTVKEIEDKGLEYAIPLQTSPKTKELCILMKNFLDGKVND